MQRLEKNFKVVMFPLPGVFILLLTLIFGVSLRESSAMENIDEFQWKKRIILIQADKPDAYLLQLKDAETEINDRHIYWFILTPSELVSNYPGVLGKGFAGKIRSSYFSGTGAGVVLIGKDGGIKKRSESLNLQGLFDLIDTMPMRRQEMRSQ